MALTDQPGSGPKHLDEKEAYEHVGDAQHSGDQSPIPGVQNSEDETLPLSYYTSWRFMGSYLAITLTAIALFVSYTMPVSDPLQGK